MSSKPLRMLSARCSLAAPALVRDDLADAILRSRPLVLLVGTHPFGDSPRFALGGTGFLVGDGNISFTNAHVPPDAADYPGNSGDVVLDLDFGVVIEVINSALVKGSREPALAQPSAISYGIPGEHVVQNAFDASAINGWMNLRVDPWGSQDRVRIADEGCGMSEDFTENQRSRPFQTTKTSGLGIGAYVSYQYLHELGDKINVESSLNQGTTVTILFPLFDACTSAEMPLLDGR